MPFTGPEGIFREAATAWVQKTLSKPGVWQRYLEYIDGEELTEGLLATEMSLQDIGILEHNMKSLVEAGYALAQVELLDALLAAVYGDDDTSSTD